MREIFKEKNVILTDKQIEDFLSFKDLLIFYNKMFNLTTITEEKEIYIKHFLDSALSKDYFKENSSVIEIGSGGGFPSIPLKILRRDLKFTLVESTGKKCSFLKEVVKNLKLDNVEVLNARAEDLGKDKKYREKFDHVTARAVARLNTLCEYCIPFIKVGGSFIALKGGLEEEIEESKSAVKILGGKIEKIEKYDLLNEGQRTIIKIEKIEKTDLKYPRGNGKERKNPL
ncbi:MAG: 16S rRNA (guanine(527)-N(7))-methyltransferase RsmG [Clostridia bacterium]|nr:16S rRNA (guanine(527)-N(7))-methyltransferase RsmG [Clostridia bacterium]